MPSHNIDVGLPASHHHLTIITLTLSQVTNRISATEEFYKRKMLGQTEIGRELSTIKQPKFQIFFICAPVLDFIDCFIRSCGHLGGEWRVLWKSTVGGDQSKKGLKKRSSFSSYFMEYGQLCVYFKAGT